MNDYVGAVYLTAPEAVIPSKLAASGMSSVKHYFDIQAMNYRLELHTKRRSLRGIYARYWLSYHPIVTTCQIYDPNEPEAGWQEKKVIGQVY